MKRPLVLPRVFQRLRRYDGEEKDGDQKNEAGWGKGVPVKGLGAE